ncbi:MAG: hypothetical protein L6Q83_13480, partial [Gammaproteobacteria bacterium]|nr:hypothetical protein [Gammaproteobacteria bacterium]
SVTSTATDDVLWGGGTSAGTNTDCNMVAVSVGASSLPAGYAASYVINRLCDADGAPGVAVPGGTNMCDAYAPTTVAADDGASMTGSAPYKAAPEPGAVKYFYRVTTRVTGPSNTVSFVQVTLVN